jgi:NAD-dependent deacetylase
VVWFGESLPPDAIARGFEAAGSCDLFFSIGTSTLVYPAAQLPFIAQDAGAFVVEVNPEPTPLTPLADISLRGPSGHWMPRLIDPLMDSDPGTVANDAGEGDS